MENKPKVILQKLRRKEADNFYIAQKYYSIISVINGLKLTERETQLVAFTAIKGNISYKHLREEFCDRYNTTSPTVNNMISKLKKTKVLIKDNSKIKVNPVIVLDFNSNIRLDINLEHGQA